MKALNVKLLFAIIVSLSLGIISCKKEDVKTEEPAPVALSIEGSWVGSYNSGPNTAGNDFRFNILTSGVLQVKNINNEVIGNGTWTLDGVNFKGVYGYTGILGKYNLAAKYNGVNKTLIGAWGTGETVADDGEFYLNKQ